MLFAKSRLFGFRQASFRCPNCHVYCHKKQPEIFPAVLKVANESKYSINYGAQIFLWNDIQL